MVVEILKRAFQSSQGKDPAESSKKSQTQHLESSEIGYQRQAQFSMRDSVTMQDYVHLLHSVGDLIHYTGESIKDESIPSDLSRDDAQVLADIGTFLRKMATQTATDDDVEQLRHALAGYSLVPSNDWGTGHALATIPVLIDLAGSMIYGGTDYQSASVRRIPK